MEGDYRREILDLFGLTEADAVAAIGEGSVPCCNCGSRWHNRALPCGCQLCAICDGRGRADDHIHTDGG